MEQKRNRCLYIHTRKDDGIIFYVGIGKKRRPYAKENRNPFWYNTVEKHDYEVKVLIKNLTWDEACELEIKMIAFYGRRDLGLGQLVNLTDGGGGSVGHISKFTKTTEQFIYDAKEVHGDKYNYDKVEYVRGDKKVIITCLEHGDFPQAPHTHLFGKGCPVCGKLKIADSGRKSLEQFIIDAKEVHGDKYIYDKVEYVMSEKEVIITCLEHGDFQQAPHSHLKGHGCKGCAGQKMSNDRRKSNDTYLQEIKQIHGDKFDYSKVNYETRESIIDLTCKKCSSDFSINASSLLKGSGCSKCNGGVKILSDDEVRWIKINYIPRDKVFGNKPMREKFGVSKGTICKIVSGEYYKHIII